MPLFYSPTAILTPYLQAFLLVTIAATDNVLSAINFPLDSITCKIRVSWLHFTLCSSALLTTLCGYLHRNKNYTIGTCGLNKSRKGETN